MKNYFFDLGISIVLTELKAALKDANHAAALKSVMLKIFNAIANVYSGDKDFKL